MRQGSVVLFDQGLYSLTNFTSGVFVARACADDMGRYGLYVLALTLLLTMELFQRCIISVPFTIYTNRATARELPGYMGNSLIFQLGFSGLGSLIFGLTAISLLLFGRDHEVARVLGALAFCLISVLLRDFVRNALLAQLRVWSAFFLGLITNLITLCTFLWAYVSDRLSASTALLLIGICSGIPAVVTLIGNRRRAHFERSRLISDLRLNWNFGRWTLAATVASSVGIRLVPWLLLIWHGKDLVATFGVITTITGIIRPAMLGMATYITPRLARHAGHSGVDATMALGIRMIKTTVILGGLYLVAMWVLGDHLVELLFTPRYKGHLLALTVASAHMSLEAIGLVLKSLVRAVGRPKIEFWSSLWASLGCVFASILLIPAGGVVGAVTATAVWSLMFTLIAYVQATSSVRKPVPFSNTEGIGETNPCLDLD